MKIRKCIDVIFTEEEAKEAFILLMDADLSDTICGTPEFDRRKNIISQLKNENTFIDFCDNKFFLVCDGAYIEDF